jgi:ADP-ribose pyrophosphatase
VVFLVRAIGLKKRSRGGGDCAESITVHEVPLGDVAQWLRRQARRGKLIDPKVYAGLYFLTAKVLAR